MFKTVQERVARSNARTFAAAAISGALVGGSTGMYAGSQGAIAGGAIGFVVGVLAGLGLASTKAWHDALHRELDRYIVGSYEPPPFRPDDVDAHLADPRDERSPVEPTG